MKKYIKPEIQEIPVFVECAVALGSVNNPNPPVNQPPSGINVSGGTGSYDAPAAGRPFLD